MGFLEKVLASPLMERECRYKVNVCCALASAYHETRARAISGNLTLFVKCYNDGTRAIREISVNCG